VRTGLYRSLAVNDEQLRTNEALQSSNVAFVRPGSKGTQIQPQTGRNAVFGGILGLIIGLGLTYLLRALDTRLRSSEEAQHRLGLPLLARIPELPSAFAKGKLAMVEDPRAPETEPFKMLATNLGLANLDRGAKSIMITSAARGEGKSTTLANMAIALARAGMRVTLVDLDLKRPGLSGLFGITSDKPGITSVAAGMAALESALTEIPLDHGEHTGSEGFAGASRGSLDLLATGPVPPDTANFVSSARLAELLARLAERSDLVLIDAPPILQISDAMALTSKVDALMVVVRLSVIRRPAIKELRRVLEAAPVAKLGCVLIEVRGEAGYYGAYTDYAAPVQSSNGARRWRVGAKTG
jgi:polysaccharide biosynthesis transport protein